MSNNTIVNFKELEPKIHKEAYIANGVVIAADVTKFAFVILDGIHSFQVVFMYILHVIVFAFAKSRWLEPRGCYRAINPCPIGGINALGKKSATTAPPLASKRLLQSLNPSC